MVISPRPVTVPSPGVSLWRPDVVITSVLRPAGAPPVPVPLVGVAPAGSPRHLQARVEAARSLLASLADALRVSRREHVSSTLEACRVEAELDAVITDTWRQITALMEERGLR